MKRKTIYDMNKLANFKNGKCVSEKYINAKTHLEWECAEGHKWNAVPDVIQRGHWCPVCSKEKVRLEGIRKRLTLEDARIAAIERGGECLSSGYKNSLELMIWKCDKGHVWKANFSHIRRGTWCRVCHNTYVAGQYHVGNIENIKKIIKMRKGILVSGDYKNAYSKFVVQCRKGHQWTINAHDIKRNHWCPTCLGSKGERIFRKILEYITGYKFNKVKPEWLKNKKGNRLEIDGYNDELKLGFEYQGRQHFKFIPGRFHENREQFLKRQEHDVIKKKVTSSKGIKLLYPDEFLKLKNFLTFILDFLKDNGFEKNINKENVENFNINNFID
jgi:hypothetical protein